MVPKMSSETYLQAVVTNSSFYSILSGPANVFLDNNFIAKVTNFLQDINSNPQYNPTSLDIKEIHKVLY